jgi:hypothetical protein
VLSGLVPEAVARGIDQLRPFGILILYALMFSGALSYLFYPVMNFVWGLLQ